MQAAAEERLLSAGSQARLDALVRAEGPVAVGLSGGGDSTALLHLAAAWGRARGRGVIALSVDHGLRAGSRDVAEAACAAAQRLGAQARLLTLAEGVAAQGGHAAWRILRHRALARACVGVGARTLLLGHTREDQAETLLMRLERPRLTVRGLCGLRPLGPAPVWPEGRGLAIARPLLNWPRASLRAALLGLGARWHDDPANEEPRFERVRARARLAALAGAGVGSAGWARIAAAAQALDAVQRAGAAALFAAAVTLTAEGEADLKAEGFAQARADVAALALEAAVQAVSGDLSPVAQDAVGRFLAQLAGRGPAQTVCGAGVWLAVAHGRGRLLRDVGAARGRADGAAGACSEIAEGGYAIWDGRWLTGPARAAGVIAAWGRSAAPRRRAAPALYPSESGIGETVAATHLGAEIAARALFPDQPEAWLTLQDAQHALGAGPRASHIRPSGRRRTGLSDTLRARPAQNGNTTR